MLRDVRHIIEDGQLGLPTDQGTGVHVKIGASPVESDKPVTIVGTMSAARIKERLGLCPLSDAVMDSVENGSERIYCFPVQPSFAGTSGSVSKTGGSAGNLTASGEPHNAFSVLVEITGQGGFNSALFTYSIDGGYSYADEQTMPLTGEFEIPNTGITLTFAETGGGEETGDPFQIGDIFQFATSAPEMSNQDVLNALEKLRAYNVDYEYVHIVGMSQAGMWSAVAEEQLVLLEQYKKPLFFIMEAYDKDEGEEIDDYALRLEEDKRGIRNYDIQIVAARGVYTRMDGVTSEINLAGVVAGLYSRATVSQSIGQTDTFSISKDKLAELRPVGIDEYIELLDKAKFLTFREYIGLEGFFVTNARMMCPDGSDYRYAEDVRVKNKLIRVTRTAALQLLQSDVDMADVDGDLSKKAMFIQAPADAMVRSKEISAVTITVPSGQDILVTETFELIIRYVPRGKIREIVIRMGVTNPMANAS